jgi:ubiquinone/menaquinone biosynthesis C-methylase UbiE
MPAPESPEAIRDVNTRYHDAAAAEYDGKWGIDFHEIGKTQVLGKLRKGLGRNDVGHFRAALEIGAGTGYFSLNLLRAGVLGHATCLDISPGMLDSLRGNAQRLGLSGLVETVPADGEHLPFDEASFDLVFGHAVLHHLPDLDQAFKEFKRVLKPGGRLVFAGEPSRQGDRIAAYPKRYALKAAPAWRALMRAKRSPGHDHGPATAHTEADGHDLEPFVDVHAFAPQTLRAFAERAAFADVKVRGEELLANWFGWANRTLESTAVPETVPWAWRQYAYRGYIALQHVDRVLLEPRLPPAIFYNLIVSARKAA